MEINLNRGMPMIPPQLPGLLILVGGGIAFLGLMLFVNEHLLRWLVAGVFVLVGLVILLIGLRAKRMLG